MTERQSRSLLPPNPAKKDFFAEFSLTPQEKTKLGMYRNVRRQLSEIQPKLDNKQDWVFGRRNNEGKFDDESIILKFDDETMLAMNTLAKRLQAGLSENPEAVQAMKKIDHSIKRAAMARAQREGIPTQRQVELFIKNPREPIYNIVQEKPTKAPEELEKWYNEGQTALVPSDEQFTPTDEDISAMMQRE